MGFRLLRRQGFRRGLLGGSRVWLWVFVIGQLLRLRRRFFGKEERVVYRHELAEGETLVVTHDRDASVTG